MLTPWLFLFFAIAASRSHYAKCPPDAVQNGLSHVQCDREPPCVRWSWLNPDKCKSMALDRSWPTYDPYIERRRDWHSMRDFLLHHAVGKNVILVGDSITSLFYNGFLCEAARSQLTLTVWGEGANPRLSNYSKNLFHGEGHTTFHVRETDTIISRRGWAFYIPHEFEKYLAVADIVLVNFGLHYQNTEVYRRDMSAMFARLEAFNKQPGKLAVFRETPSQSFVGTGAYAGATAKCAPLGDDVVFTNTVYRQNEAASALGAHHGVPTLHFYNLTVPRWNLREETFCAENGKRPGCNDCTHLCASPTLYAKLVDDLYYITTQAKG